jgi:hypothetical protein
MLVTEKDPIDAGDSDFHKVSPIDKEKARTLLVVFFY